jgi:hypothetical protein
MCRLYCCRSNSTVEVGGAGVRGSVDVITIGREVTPHQGGAGRAKEEERGGESLLQWRKRQQHRQRSWAQSGLWA